MHANLAGIQEWCNHRCMTLNPNKTKALVVSKSGLWALPMVTWSCLGFLSEIVGNLTSLVWSLTGMSPQWPCARYCFSCLSENWDFEVVEPILVDTSGLLRCYFVFVLPIIEYCSPVWWSAAECNLQLLERQVYSVARLCPSRVSRRCIIDVVWMGLVCCTRLIRTL